MAEDHAPAVVRPVASVRSRVLVALAIGSCGAIYASGLSEGQPASLVAIAGGLVWFTAYFSLRRHVQEAADLPDERLDEREISVRDRGYLNAYRLLGGALAVSLILAITDDALDGRVVSSWNGPIAALLLSAVLPSAVLAIGMHVEDHTDT